MYAFHKIWNFLLEKNGSRRFPITVLFKGKEAIPARNGRQFQQGMTGDSSEEWQAIQARNDKRFQQGIEGDSSKELKDYSTRVRWEQRTRKDAHQMCGCCFLLSNSR
jgi:hypothetical protein